MDKNCGNCRYGRQACNEKCIVCNYINDINVTVEKRRERAESIDGNVYAGWTNGGMGIVKSYVNEKTAVCPAFREKQ